MVYIYIKEEYVFVDQLDSFECQTKLFFLTKLKRFMSPLQRPNVFVSHRILFSGVKLSSPNHMKINVSMVFFKQQEPLDLLQI